VAARLPLPGLADGTLQAWLARIAVRPGPCAPGQWMSSRRNASIAAARAHRPVMVSTA
jgi:hypothetical protein